MRVVAPADGGHRDAWPGAFSPIERLIDALVDPKRRERTALIVLAAYVFFWTLYGVIAKSSQDLQEDAAELVSWSHHLEWGYSKHPPFAAWVVHAWYSVFPIADWSYYLLSIAYAATGLWIAWRLFRHFLDPLKRVVALACLTLVPFYNFHGLRFDHNAVLGVLWAATTLCFIQSFKTRSAGWAALAGAAAAAAMLGKYWSIFLLAGLVLAALLDRRRNVYFRSAAPWITFAVGVALLAPHIVWLANHDFVPFVYAVAEHDTQTLGQSLVRVAAYFCGGVGYAAVPVALVLIAARPTRAAVIDMLAPKTTERRFAAVAFWAPLLLPIVVALACNFEINSLWTMSGFVLLPVVLMSSPLIVLPRKAVTLIVAFAVALPPLMLALSPAIAFAIHLRGVSPSAADGRLLAARIEQVWRQSTDHPLRIVAGPYDLANVAAFYVAEQPAAYPLMEPDTTPWITPEKLFREGAAFVCYLGDGNDAGQNCRGAAAALINEIAGSGADGRRFEVTLARTFFGDPGRPRRYAVIVVPPAVEEVQGQYPALPRHGRKPRG